MTTPGPSERLEPTGPPGTPGGAVIAGGWGAIAALFTLHHVLTYDANGAPVPLGTAAAWSLCEWLPWMLLTPLVFALARRCAVRRSREGAANVVVHLAAALVASALHVTMEALLDRAFVELAGTPAPSIGGWLSGDVAEAPVAWGYLFRRKLGFNLFVYAVLVGVTHTAAAHRLSRERALQAARLEADLAGARLQALQAQLQPHFLFNALNAIAALVYDDPAKADRMLVHLGALLRAALDVGARSAVPLARELELVEAYLAIEKARLGERLAVVVDVEAAALAAPVPPFLLQPLVENAVRHGVAPREEGGRVEVRARAAAGLLALEVQDDGQGLADRGVAPHPGIGLANTRARLEALFPGRHRLELANAEGGGVVVRIELPTPAVEAAA